MKYETAKYNKKEALELWEKGTTFAELSKKYGYHINTIKKYARLESPNYTASIKKHHASRNEASLQGVEKYPRGNGSGAQVGMGFSTQENWLEISDKAREVLIEQYQFRCLEDFIILYEGKRSVGKIKFESDGSVYYVLSHQLDLS